MPGRFPLVARRWPSNRKSVLRCGGHAVLFDELLPSLPAATASPVLSLLAGELIHAGSLTCRAAPLEPCFCDNAVAATVTTVKARIMSRTGG